jgi:peroxidase
MASPSSALTCLVIVLSITSSLLLTSEAHPLPPIVSGLSWTFYNSKCPKLESIVHDYLKNVFKADVGQAAGLLRLHFHDCFVQGCDASVLLDGSASGPSEQEAPPNLTLRAQAFKIIDEINELVKKQCGTAVVSCSDLVTLAARDSVYLTGGPHYPVPLGRRDGLTFATTLDTINNLVASSANTTTLLSKLAAKNLTTTDAVALSGGHTIGISHCSSFTDRLYPTQDSTLDKTFANNLKATCPSKNSTNTTNLDIRSPDKFDNKYFVNLMNRQGLFTSDQDMYMDKRTKVYVISYAVNEFLFFKDFANSMIKMGQISVLTGTQGEVRTNCSFRNSDNKNLLIKPVVDEDEIDEESLSEF